MAFNCFVEHAHFLECGAQIGVGGCEVDLQFECLEQRGDCFLIAFGINQGAAEVRQGAGRIGCAADRIFKIGDRGIGVVFFVQRIGQADTCFLAVGINGNRLLEQLDGIINAIGFQNRLAEAREVAGIVGVGGERFAQFSFCGAEIFLFHRNQAHRMIGKDQPRCALEDFLADFFCLCQLVLLQ